LVEESQQLLQYSRPLVRKGSTVITILQTIGRGKPAVITILQTIGRCLETLTLKLA
jgi:hypothetical protein